MTIANAQQPWEPAKRILTHYRVGLIALSLTLLGAALRLYHIGANGLNTDEIWSVWLTRHDLAFVVQTTTLGGADPSSPPLYYVLMWFVTQLGQQLLVARFVSVLAGTAMVWLTFRLAMDLFDDLRIAALSALLVAISPILITWSRVARAYTPVSLWAFISLYFFALLLFKSKGAGKWIWLGLVLATAAAIWTHYQAIFIIMFENAVVAFLWLRGHASRALLTRWFVSQAVLGILILPALLGAYSYMPAAARSEWPRPDLQTLLKSAILFNTGDPSYGPTGFTLARFLSLLAIVGIWILALSVLIKRGNQRRLDDEGRRILYLIGAALVPLALVLAFSLVRPLYVEKYFLFVVPCLFIVLAWAVMRARRARAAALLLLTFVAMLGSALYVYYSEPFGEQWREAISFVRSSPESEDLAIMSPGFYSRPFAHYFSGNYPADTETLDRAPAVVFDKGEFRVFDPTDPGLGFAAEDSTSAPARRIWFVSGYSPADPGVTKWIEQNFETLDTQEYLGVQVRLLQRIKDSQLKVNTDQE